MLGGVIIALQFVINHMTNKVGVSGDEFMLFNPNPCLFKMQINNVKMLMYLVLSCMIRSLRMNGMTISFKIEINITTANVQKLMR
jgi:hypothetical protein